MIEEEPQPEEQSVDLDEYLPVLEAWYEASREIKALEAKIDQYKTLLGKIMGDATIGRIDGQVAITYRGIESFSSTEFKKKYPETYRFFVHDVTEKRFDKQWLRQSRPDLWEEFQTRPMKNSYVPRDKAQ